MEEWLPHKVQLIEKLNELNNFIIYSNEEENSKKKFLELILRIISIYSISKWNIKVHLYYLYIFIFNIFFYFFYKIYYYFLFLIIVIYFIINY